MASKPYFELEQLLREAERIAGALDWGDNEFREPLSRFIGSLNSDADLTDQGVARTKSHILKMLVGRLRLFADRQRIPGIAREVIRAPLFIAGHGRSGTSYLNALLALDPRHYAPLHWQIWTLSPPVNHPATDNRPQIAQGAHFINFEGWQDPDVRIRHDYANESAAEDTLITDYSFIGKSFGFFWNAPSYAQWLFAQADFGAGYRIEKKILQAMQYGMDRDRWILKSPTHIDQLDKLFAEYPDGNLIINHRDPVKSLASIIGLFHGHRKQFGNTPVKIGREFMLLSIEGTARTTRQMMRYREENPENDKRIVDIRYLDLEREPLAQLEKIYDAYDIAFTPEARTAMTRYVAENRKGRHGVHKYDIADLGVSPGEVREAFQFYYEAYDIPFE